MLNNKQGSGEHAMFEFLSWPVLESLVYRSSGKRSSHFVVYTAQQQQFNKGYVCYEVKNDVLRMKYKFLCKINCCKCFAVLLSIGGPFFRNAKMGRKLQTANMTLY